MSLSKDDNTSDDTVKLLSYLAILIVIIVGLRECSNTSIKARAYEKIEEDRSRSPEDAYEEAEYEHDESIDGMIENQSY